MNKKLVVLEDNCCKPSVKPSLNKQQAENAVKLFAALADEIRLLILNMLAESGSEVCVCDITAAFNKSQPTISHHLRILREEGLINGDKRGKWVYYSLVPGRAEEIQNLVQKLLPMPVAVR